MSFVGGGGGGGGGGADHLSFPVYGFKTSSEAGPPPPENIFWMRTVLSHACSKSLAVKQATATLLFAV